MTLWTVAFDAAISVSVEAETLGDATARGEEVVSTIPEEDLRLRDGVDCSIGQVFLIRNEETGEEFYK